MSWMKEDAQGEADLHKNNTLYIDDNLHETHMELTSLNDEIIINTTTTDEVELDKTNMDMITNNEIVYPRVETPPLSKKSRMSPATTRAMRGSKGGSGMLIRRSNENEVELEEIVLQAREGVGVDGADIGIGGLEGTNRLSNQALKVSAILHAPQSPPSSPPHEPLNSLKQSRRSIGNNNNNNNKDEDEDEDEDNTEDDMEGEEIEFVEDVAQVVCHYDIEAYGNETAHIVDMEGGDVQVEGVGMGIAPPKQDKMVLKEVIRISALAIVAIIVVLIFVFT